MNVLRWALFLIFCATAIARAQQSPLPAADGQTPSQKAPNQNSPELSHRPPPHPGSPEGKIKLDVVVTDSTGRPVAGLQRQDFTLFDNKKPQPILSFQEVNGSTGNGTAVDPPVEVILLIDATNNSPHNIAYERSQMEMFLRQNGGHLAQPVTLMVFSEQGVKVQPHPSKDGNMLADSLEKIEATTHLVPRSAGYDAMERMQLSLKTLRRIATVETTKPGRKMLIWIGPGWPMLQGAAYQSSANSERLLFNAIVEMTQLLREARITMYSANPRDPEAAMNLGPDYYKDFLKGVPSAKRAESGDLAVPVFAIHSGGLVDNRGDDLVRQLNSCIADATAYYTLSFDPPGAEHTDEYHELEVKVAEPYMKVRTNTGYYSEPLPKP
jgi:VWFA-related protein